MSDEKTGMIYRKMIEIMREVDAIGKKKNNVQQGFKYRGIDDIMNEVHPLMSKHGVFIQSSIVSSEREVLKTKSGGDMISSIIDYNFTFFAEDGSSVSSIVRGEGRDSADKASNKSMAVALKYCITTAFLIPTEDLADPDRETPPQASKPTKKQCPEDLLLSIMEKNDLSQSITEMQNNHAELIDYVLSPSQLTRYNTNKNANKMRFAKGA